MQIQSQMDGSVSVVSCKRELIKQGKVSTVNPRTAKLSERYVFLVSSTQLSVAGNVTKRVLLAGQPFCVAPT